ncbi:MAG TPA: cation:proton antiporter, partial [Elusimicrobiales bacterium]|nr:cation:proton antiporter [Elusimicrobiales bacterium]
MSSSIIFAGLLIILGHAFKVFFDKTRIPDVIPLVLLGIFVGPVLGMVNTANFGIMGEMLSTLALSIILFYSGLEINLETATKSLLAGTKTALMNFVLAMILGACMTILWLDNPTMEALAIGAMLGGTSFAIVIPLANEMQISQKTKTILLLESTFTDVLCIVVTLGLFQMIRLRELNPGFITGQILASFTMSSLIGALAAIFWATALGWVRKLENDMLLTPAVIITIFGLTEFLGYSGAISSLAFGIVSGNLRQLLTYPLFNGLKQSKILEFNTVELALFS